MTKKKNVLNLSAVAQDVQSGTIFNKKTGKPLSPITIKTTLDNISILRKFIEETGHRYVQPGVGNALKAWLINRGLSDSTVYKILGTFKFVVDHLGYDISSKEIRFSFRMKEVETMNPTQIRFVFSNYEKMLADCTTDEQRAIVKYLLVGLIFGARKGDMELWTSDNLYRNEEDGELYLKYRPKKTAYSSAVVVDVPVPSMALSVFNMSGTGPLMPELSTSCNKLLKRILSRYDVFHNEVQVFRKGRYVKMRYCDSVYMHQLRASSASDKLMFMPEAMVREWTGHTHNSRSFSRYISVSKEAKKSMASSYFNALQVQ